MTLPPQPLSPLDGRYSAAVSALGEHLSEAGLNRARVHVEVEWLLALTDRRLFGSEPVDAAAAEELRRRARDFGQPEIDRLAELGAAPMAQDQATPEALSQKLQEQIDLWAPILEPAPAPASATPTST